MAQTGLVALCGIAAYYRIAADPVHLAKELALQGGEADDRDIVRAARTDRPQGAHRGKPVGETLACAPAPALLRRKDGGYVVFGGGTPAGLMPHRRSRRPASRSELSLDDLRRGNRARADPDRRGIFTAPASIRAPSASCGSRPRCGATASRSIHVLVASFFVQIFALVSPLFFQVVIDKVLTHRGYSTLFVLVGGLALIGLFDVALQYLRTYALSHTTNRIDVELGQRLFRHCSRLPVSYFETRPTGQTVARVRELETIRAFLTGQGLFSALDLFFTFVFIAVLFAYSWKLTLIVLATIPLYLIIAALARPLLREKLNEKFNRGAESQQFLVEAIVGMQTIKAAAVEPVVREAMGGAARGLRPLRLQRPRMLGAKGQNAIQYVNKLSTAALLLFGAKAVIDGELTVGELVAFNMIAGQVAQPVLRLSQLWQDFQQVQVSVERLGDILNAPVEPTPAVARPAAAAARKDRIPQCLVPLPSGRAAGAEADFAARLARQGRSASSVRPARASRRWPS